MLQNSFPNLAKGMIKKDCNFPLTTVSCLKNVIKALWDLYNFKQCKKVNVGFSWLNKVMAAIESGGINLASFSINLVKPRSNRWYCT